MVRMRIFLPLLMASTAGYASAQSFNLDVGANQSHPLPSTLYGAGAGQSGFWNGVSTTGQVAVGLSDLSGVATPVTVTPQGGFGDFAINNPNWNGDDDLLLEDASDVGNTSLGAPGGTIVWTFANLLPGDYTVYTYAIAPDFPQTYYTKVSVAGANEGQQQVGPALWSGSPHAQGITYARHTLTLAAGANLVVTTDTLNTPTTNYGSINGFQLVRAPVAPGTAYCFGDGSGTACPCGNNSAAGSNAGCLSSLGVGAVLGATGLASLANDSVALLGSGMPNSNALYFQGTSQTSAGAGALFGDGLRCASGTVVRLGTKSNIGGASQYPVTGDQTISVRGVVPAGATRNYQVWYRNAAAFCTASTFNLTNGYSITWGP